MAAEDLVRLKATERSDLATGEELVQDHLWVHVGYPGDYRRPTEADGRDAVRPSVARFAIDQYAG